MLIILLSAVFNNTVLIQWGIGYFGYTGQNKYKLYYPVAYTTIPSVFGMCYTWTENSATLGINIYEKTTTYMFLQERMGGNGCANYVADWFTIGY